MLHGDKTRFAIQWELDADPVGHFLLGKMCFWVANTVIGNYESRTTLSDVLAELVYPVSDCGKRRGDQFCHLSAEDAFSMLHRGLFESDPSLCRTVEDESWARFDVSIFVDTFQRWRLYLVDCEFGSRFLVAHIPKESDHFEFVMEQSLRVGEFDQVIIEFQRELELALEEHRNDST
jgi:hypothetical protein